MMVVSRCLYRAFKKYGLCNWGFLKLEHPRDFDWDDLVTDYQRQCIQLDEFEE